MNIWEKLPVSRPEGLQKDIFYLGVTLLLVGGSVAFGNLTTPEEPLRVGMVELETECVGIDAGVCLGIQRREHITYNYQNYTEAEEGTANYYRRVEAELMIQAYNICNEEISGMEWTSEASYDNKTAEEWGENENVTLLPCESTFYRPLK